MSLSFTCWPWSKKLGLGLATSFCEIVYPSVVLTWREISFTNGNCMYRIVDLSGSYLICFHIVPLCCFILDGILPRLKGTENQGIGSTTASRMVNLLCLGKKDPFNPAERKDIAPVKGARKGPEMEMIVFQAPWVEWQAIGCRRVATFVLRSTYSRLSP